MLRQTFSGFRLHPRCSPDGVILDYDLAPANASDAAMARGFDLPAGGTGIGDRNDRSPDPFGGSAAAGVTLHAPDKDKSRDPDPARSAKPRAARRVIETVFGQLAERFGIKRVRARGLWRLGHRVIRKVLGHTVAVWLGVLEGHGPLRFAQLLTE